MKPNVGLEKKIMVLFPPNFVRTELQVKIPFSEKDRGGASFFGKCTLYITLLKTLRLNLNMYENAKIEDVFRLELSASTAFPGLEKILGNCYNQVVHLIYSYFEFVKINKIPENNSNLVRLILNSTLILQQQQQGNCKDFFLVTVHYTYSIPLPPPLEDQSSQNFF